MKRTGYVMALLLWIPLFIWGVSGVVQRFTHGHEPAHYGSYVPWGLWVSGYIYFIGLSAGAFLLSSLVYVFRIESMRKIGRVALFSAAVTLMMALLTIWFDLGHMERAWEIMIRPNFSSMMAWMVWLYTAYFLLILAELWIETRCDLAKRAERGGRFARLSRVLALGWRCPSDAAAFAACHDRSRNTLRILGCIGVPLAVAFHGGVGALFATLASRPYWHHSLFPILFLTGALVSGGALLMAVVAITGSPKDPRLNSLLRSLGWIVVGLLVFDLILEWSETSIPMWYGIGHDYGLYVEILFGRFWYVFWIVHLGTGSLIPLVLLIARPGARWACAISGLLIAATFLAVRLNLVIPGQVSPALEGLREAYVDQRLQFDYVPSLFEWSVIAFVITSGLAAFCVGHYVLPLEDGEEPQPA